ncbi:MAG: iron-sulfur cluster assembly accessory protein [Ferruginibacter sp.]
METKVTPPINFTESAVVEIKRLMNADGFDSEKLLRVGVKGGGCSGMTYILDFETKTDNDEVFESGTVSFIVDRSHSIYLIGMEVNWEGGLNSRGFTFKNPNASATCGCGTSFAV